MVYNYIKIKTPLEIKVTDGDIVKEDYNRVATEYNKLAHPKDKKVYYCHKCGNFLTASDFYTDDRNASGLFYMCKNCVQEIITPKKKDGDIDEYKRIKYMLQLMDRPFIEELYKSCVEANTDFVSGEKIRMPFDKYITLVKGKRYRGMGYADSDFIADNIDVDDDGFTNDEQAKIQKATKRFGKMAPDDLLFLENEYEDWVGRYECQTKAQETLFAMICFNRLEAMKLRKAGKTTKDVDKSMQDMLSTLNIQPKQNQNSMDAMSDAQTFGTLLRKYEETRPLPEIDPELKDVDKIGLYIDAFYRGHMAKMLGKQNTFTNIYEKVMDKYTVKPPKYDPDNDDSESLFDQIFSNSEEY